MEEQQARKIEILSRKVFGFTWWAAVRWSQSTSSVSLFWEARSVAPRGLRTTVANKHVELSAVRDLSIESKTVFTIRTSDDRSFTFRSASQEYYVNSLYEAGLLLSTHVSPNASNKGSCETPSSMLSTPAFSPHSKSSSAASGGVRSLTFCGVSFHIDRRFVDLKPIGAGVSGLVIGGRDLESGVLVAIKKLCLHDSLVEDIRALREVRLSSVLRHPNLSTLLTVMVPLPGTEEALDAVYLVSQRMPCSLAHLLDAAAADTTAAPPPAATPPTAAPPVAAAAATAGEDETPSLQQQQAAADPAAAVVSSRHRSDGTEGSSAAGGGGEEEEGKQRSSPSYSSPSALPPAPVSTAASAAIGAAASARAEGKEAAATPPPAAAAAAAASPSNQPPTPAPPMLSPQQVRALMAQLLRALRYLHRCNVVHRDVKPQNLLVDGNCHLRLCDLGLAREAVASTTPSSNPTPTPPPPAVAAAASSMGSDEKKPVAAASEALAAAVQRDGEKTQYVYTRSYRAPEISMGGDYGTAADMWAAGCVLAEMLQCVSGLPPAPLFAATDYRAQLRRMVAVLGQRESDIARLRRGHARSFMERCGVQPPTQSLRVLVTGTASGASRSGVTIPPAALDLLQQLLQWNPSQRPSAAAALCHPWLAGLQEGEAVEDAVGVASSAAAGAFSHRPYPHHPYITTEHMSFGRFVRQQALQKPEPFLLPATAAAVAAATAREAAAPHYRLAFLEPSGAPTKATTAATSPPPAAAIASSAAAVPCSTIGATPPASTTATPSDAECVASLRRSLLADVAQYSVAGGGRPTICCTSPHGATTCFTAPLGVRWCAGSSVMAETVSSAAAFLFSRRSNVTATAPAAAVRLANNNARAAWG